MDTQQRGTITTWKDDKGFGFITPDTGGASVFVHVSGFVPQHKRPSTNMVVRYTLIQDERQRARAINVHAANQPHTQIAISWCSTGLFFLVLVLATRIIPLPLWIVLLYTISSGLTYGLYALDKASAMHGTWRIPENALHFLELVGGWPGAVVAQATFRHKTVKASYQAQFWMIVLSNLALLIGYSWLQRLSTT